MPMARKKSAVSVLLIHSANVVNKCELALDALAFSAPSVYSETRSHSLTERDI